MNETPLTPKRESILAASLKVFSEKGFHNAKIEEIAQVAQVGKGTVYEYFQSKNQLFQEMLKEGMTAFDRAMEACLQQEDSVKGKLKVIIRQSIQLGHDYRPLAKVALLEGTVIEESIREWMISSYIKRVRRIEAIIQEGIDKGEFRLSKPKLFTSLFYAAMGGLHSPFMEEDLSLEGTEELVEQIIDILYHGIAL